MTDQACTNLSLRHPEDWESLTEALKATHLAAVAAGNTSLLMGDTERGPLLVLTAVPPDQSAPRTPAHMHASDSWRIALKGAIEMGREIYGPGEFRCQEGWKAYPSDTLPHGPEGGWGMIVMGDRRGVRARTVQPAPPGFDEAHQLLAELFGIGGDLISDDPADTAGPSGLATTLGRASNGGKLNGSFAASDGWRRVSPATRAEVVLVGAADCGPVIILSCTEPNKLAAPESTFGTEVFRLVVGGSCSIGDQLYEAGDARVQPAGTRCEAVDAGEGGLQEVIVLGDRRRLAPALEENDGWPSAISVIVDELMDELATRNGTEVTA